MRSGEAPLKVLLQVAELAYRLPRSSLSYAIMLHLKNRVISRKTLFGK